MSSNIRTIKSTDRQELVAKDGVRLQRKYLYLLPETWLALQVLVRETGLNQSTIIKNMIANEAGKDKEPHDNYKNH
ncbi:MAG: hypothetical protein Q7T66_04785 [Herminiimonas sp.]|uniref:hypothetical protein n=1 Tax=Herminiimonas sp. TaxID=1926289 RepID=UPI00271EDA46|nr:hypothetical protein [Herminiimonas sp.]MDO9419961.1 hypothetical protein [Herminiimonas sp.]